MLNNTSHFSSGTVNFLKTVLPLTQINLFDMDQFSTTKGLAELSWTKREPLVNDTPYGRKLPGNKRQNKVGDLVAF